MVWCRGSNTYTESPRPTSTPVKDASLAGMSPPSPKARRNRPSESNTQSRGPPLATMTLPRESRVTRFVPRRSNAPVPRGSPRLKMGRKAIRHVPQPSRTTVSATWPGAKAGAPTMARCAMAPAARTLRPLVLPAGCPTFSASRTRPFLDGLCTGSSLGRVRPDVWYYRPSKLSLPRSQAVGKNCQPRGHRRTSGRVHPDDGTAA